MERDGAFAGFGIMEPSTLYSAAASIGMIAMAQRARCGARPSSPRCSTIAAADHGDCRLLVLQPHLQEDP